MAAPVLVYGPRPLPRAAPVLRAGLVLGAGLAAVLDGVVFHEILQWHRFADARADDPDALLLADGLFHAAAWLVVVAGVALLWRAARSVRAPVRRGALLGSAVAGAGLFQATETAIVHFLLGLHRLHPSGDPAWDVGLLVLSLLAAGLGWRAALAGEETGTAAGGRRHRRAWGR